MKKAVVCLSGGQDSTTVLAYALCNYDYVETVGFNYSQRHQVEMNSRLEVRAKIVEVLPQFAHRLGPDTVFDVTSFGKAAHCGLTREHGDFVKDDHGHRNSFVPARNLMFLTYAAARAYCIGATDILTGVAGEDFDFYPDCRKSTIEAMQRALCLGCEFPFVIKSPVLGMTKAEEWQFAEQLGGPALVNMIVEFTHSCYEGDRDHRHSWGYGCGKCPACQVRKAGFDEYLKSKFTEYVQRKSEAPKC